MNKEFKITYYTNDYGKGLIFKCSLAEDDDAPYLIKCEEWSSGWLIPADIDSIIRALRELKQRRKEG